MKSDKKRQYDSGKTRKSLTTAAVDLFSRIGYDAATTRGIAKKAGVNESLIQRYFTNKLGLFSSVVEECQKRLGAQLPYEPASTLEEELLNFLNFRMEFARKEKKLYRLIISRAVLDRRVVSQMNSLTENGIPTLVERLALLQKQGTVKGSLNLPSASLIVGAVSFSLSMWVHIMGKLDESKTDEVLKLASQILAKGMTPD